MATKTNTDINLWDVLYKHRLGWGPVYVGMGMVALAGLSSLVSTWQAVLALLAIFGAIAAWVHTRVRDGMKQAYAYAVLTLSLAWVLTAREMFPEAFDWLAITLLAGVFLLGIPWWTSNVKRTQVKIEANVRNWPVLAKRIGLDKLNITNPVMTNIGRQGMFTWPDGEYEVDQVIGHQGRIEGALGADRGSLRMKPNGKSSNSVLWRVLERDPHAAAQPWPLPTHVGSATDPMVLGPTEEGEDVKVQRYVKGRGVRHMLIAGMNDSGKSSLINLDVATGVCHDDEFVIGLDFKQVELTPWKPALGYMTSSVSMARKLIFAIASEGGGMDARSAKLAKRGVRVWDTDIDGPIVNIVVDEAKDLLGMGDSKLVDKFALIGTKGRALGFRFVLATQFPTLEAIGSSQIRQQIRHRFCFRMQDSKGEGFVMPEHVVHADKIDADRPGTTYFLDGNKLVPDPLRILYLDDPTVAAVAAERAGKTAELDRETEEAIVALFPEFADRERYTSEPGSETPAGSGSESGGGTEAGVSGTETGSGGEAEEEEMSDIPPWDEGPDVDMADVIEARRERMTQEERERSDRDRETALNELESTRLKLTEEESKQEVLRALAQAWPEGMRARDLIEVSGKSSSWFYPVAAAWAEQGIVERTKHGTWGLVAPPVESVPKPEPSHAG